MWERGELVWANVDYRSNSWLPALISDPNDPDIGILVSFFNLRPPRYFVRRQLLSFLPNFKSLISTTNFPNNNSSTGILVHFALRYLHRSFGFALWCPCQPPFCYTMPSEKQCWQLSPLLFSADKVLVFLKRAAVYPWVENDCLADEAVSCAQLLSFRRYSFDCEGSQAVFEEVRINFVEHEYADTATDEHVSETMHEIQLDNMPTDLTEPPEAHPHNDMLFKLQCLAVDPFCLERANLGTLMYEVLKTRTLFFQDIYPRCSKDKFEDCEGQFSRSQCDTTPDVDSLVVARDFSLSVACHVENFAVHEGPKRGIEFDHFATSECSLKVCKSMASSMDGGNAYLQKSKAIGQSGTSDSLLPVPAKFDPSSCLYGFTCTLSKEAADTYLQTLRAGYKADIIVVAFCPGHQIKIRMENLNTNENQCLTFTYSNNLLELVRFIRDIFMPTHTSACAEFGGFNEVQELQEKFHFINDCGTSICNVTKDRPESCMLFLKDNGCHTIYALDATEDRILGNIIGDVQAVCHVISLQPHNAELEPAPNHLTGAPDDTIDLEDGSAASAEQLSSFHVATDNEMQISSIDNATSIKARGRVNDDLASGNRLKKIKVAVGPFTADLHLNLDSQVTHKSIDGSFANSNSLSNQLPTDNTESESKPANLVGAPDDIVNFDDGNAASTKQSFHPNVTIDQNKMQVSSGDNLTSIKSKRKANDNVLSANSMKRKKIANKLLPSHVATDENEMKVSSGGEITSIKIKRKVNDSEASRSRLKRKKAAHCPVAADLHLTLDSQKAPERSDASFSNSSSLRMKFLGNCKLPSKEDLVKKFRVFGKIDCSEVYFYTGAAKVIFSEHVDAVAAYRYAKSQRVVFGQSNVLYWLDPFDDARKATKVSMPGKQEEPAPRSCLKAGNSAEKAAKRTKEKRSVRFRIETN